MTNEEMNKMEKNMQFIVEQQALFAANIIKHDERFALIEERSALHEERLALLEEKHIQFEEQHIQTDKKIAKLTEEMSGLKEMTLANSVLIGKLAEFQKQAHEEMVESSKITDAKFREMSERMDAFILMLEKYISRKDNEKGEPLN